MRISDIEIGTIINFLNEEGYVLDFTQLVSTLLHFKALAYLFVRNIRSPKEDPL